MIPFFNYLLISTVCLSISYGFYLILFRKESGFVYLRAFLLVSIFISLLLPLSPLRIETGNPAKEVSGPALVGNVSNSGMETEDVRIIHDVENPDSKASGMEITTILLFVYLLGVSFVLLWVFFQIFRIVKLLFTSRRMKLKGFKYAINKKVKTPFSFFSCIFLPEEFADTEESNIVVRHEKIHVSEHHSLDMLLANLLCAFMWFNPLIWRMRSSIQLVHEYLADEGTLTSGYNRNVYMALMLNQATEGKLIPLYSSFNRSLLKNRMIMLAKNNTTRRNNYKILALIPLAVFLLLAVACVNGGKEPDNTSRENVTLAVETVKMNVVYAGVDNPVIIAANSIDQTKLEVSIDNGKITKEGDQFIITPAKAGSASVEIFSDGIKIGSKDFRVLRVPDPQTYLVLNDKSIAGGEISVADLADAAGIDAEIPDFIYDIDYRITGFQIRTNLNGINMVEVSDDGQFTSDQLELLKRLKAGQIVIFDDIKAIGPDGSTRLLRPMEFRII